MAIGRRQCCPISISWDVEYQKDGTVKYNTYGQSLEGPKSLISPRSRTGSLESLDVILEVVKEY